MSELSLQELESTAASYEELLVPALLQPWTPRVLDAARPAPGERALDVPTLLLLGGDSPLFFKAATEAIAAALANSKVVVMLGQKPIAIDTAPELFAREVAAFVGGSSEGGA